MNGFEDADPFRTGEKTMANKALVPEAKEALERFKMEAANEVGVNLKQGYNGDLTSKQAGSVGGQMVKKMIQSYENSMK
jgi:small acid-soluble spore protein D (minor alpha/beta-type SASP)